PFWRNCRYDKGGCALANQKRHFSSSELYERNRLPLAIRSNGLLFVGQIDQLIAHIPLPRAKAQLFNRGANLVEREVMDGAGFRDDVLFDHQAAHVVGAEEEGQLANLQPLSDPARLNVRNVVKIEPAHGLR